MDDLGVPLFLEPPKCCFFCESVACYLWSCYMGFFTVSEFPFSWEVYQIWEQEGARLVVENLHPEKRRVVFDPMLAPFPMFFCAKKLNHRVNLPRFVMYEMALSSSTCVIFKKYFVCIFIMYLMISPKCDAAENSSNLSERFFGAQTSGHCGAVLGLPCGW